MKLNSLLFAFLFSNFIIAQTHKVLIIGIDGCRPDALQAANTPNLDALVANATYSWDALNDGITISGPGWSSMLTGVWHDKHGVTGNSFSGSNYDAFPHFFKRVEDYNSNLSTASICQWGPINDFIALSHADYSLNVGSGDAVKNEAIDYLTNNLGDVLFLHFDDVDHAGHAYGFSPDVANYINTIEEVDADIGEVVDFLHNRPVFAAENWIIIISTDHGGLGTSHGGTSIEEENIFVIVSGDEVPNQEIAKETTTTETPLPENCLGQTEELTFDGVDDYVTISNDGTFDFGTSQDFTIECRVRTDTPGDVSIVGNKDWDSGGNKGFVISFKYPSGPEWKVNIGDGSNRADINTGGLIADNEWHTLSVTFDRDGNMTMYEDGQMVAATDISFIEDITTNFDLRFGVDGEGDYDYKGAIEEVRIWDEVLSPTAIQDWYCSSVDNTHPHFASLIGYWKMKEGSGSSIVADFSGNNNTGNIVGATWQTPSTMETIEDYSQTPRITDVAVTALTHLCIPVEPEWNLDGNSLVAECTALSINNPSPLFELKASWENQDVLLEWEFLNNEIDHFIIEKSENSIDFSSIAILENKGKSPYQFLDKKNNAALSYYRVQSVGQNGIIQLSNTVAVENTAGFPFQIFPNPATSECSILFKNSTKVSDLQIIDLNGKIVYERGLKDEKEILLDLEGWLLGVYFVKIRNKGRKYVRKLVVK